MRLISAGYGSAGERCMAISAVVAVGDIADALVAKLKTKAEAIKVGPGDALQVSIWGRWSPAHLKESYRVHRRGRA